MNKLFLFLKSTFCYKYKLMVHQTAMQLMCRAAWSSYDYELTGNNTVIFILPKMSPSTLVNKYFLCSKHNVDGITVQYNLC